MQLDATGHGRWTARWPDQLMAFELADGDLRCTAWGALDVEPDERRPNFVDTLVSTRSLARLSFGPDRRPSTWARADWSTDGDHTVHVTLTDDHQPVRATVSFRRHPSTGVVESTARVDHAGDGSPVELTGATSCSLALPATVEEALVLTGSWGAETQATRTPIGSAGIRLESRSGKSGYEFSPYLAVLGADHTYVVQLCWSGNWQLDLRRDHRGVVHLSGGLNEWGLRHRIAPGASLDLPPVLLVSVARGAEDGLDAATHALHRHRRNVVRPPLDRPVPVQYNSWYPYFDRDQSGELDVHFDMPKLRQSAIDGARLGCEVFVLDGGWCALDANPDDAHWLDDMGDWAVNRTIFAHGLEELSDHCRSLGLEFGLWFEPEASGVGSVVEREHPDWLHRTGDHTLPSGRFAGRSRAVLHLGVPEARAFQRSRIVERLRSTGATWIKWDFNTNLDQGGWSSGLPDHLTAADPLVAHVHGLYSLLDDVRADVPGIVVESCAGGGGRLDAGIAAHAHVHWASDEVNALRRLAINVGSLHAHPVTELNTWLVDWPPHHRRSHDDPAVDPRGDLAFRTRAAMLGSFGISAPTWRWSDAEFELVARHVATYRDAIRPLLDVADAYLLTPPPPLDGEGDWAAVWFAAPDRSGGVLYAFRLAGADAARRFPLAGLDHARSYTTRTIDAERRAARGSDLAGGLDLRLDEPFRAEIVIVEAA